MPRDTLTGSRIRERRIARGVKQADLARSVNISASYLNLIEHNRRRIGGKLLNAIAEHLAVEPAALTEGAGAQLIASLREAASERPQAGAELDRVDEFAGRFPGWALLLAEARGRIATLERTVAALTDRMTHDPHLATSLHEMLTTVTAIRSAASILAEPGEIEPEWQARFHRNIYEDSARLAETSRGLVAYLDADEEAATDSGTPQEEVDAVLARAGHHVPALEAGGTTATAVSALGQGLSGPALALLRVWLTRYAEDVGALPLARLADAIGRTGPDPAALSQALGVDPGRVMRRLAAMPEEVLPDPVGLAICDASGALSYRKPLPDFPMPRFGAACPLWPLYRALNRPFVILSEPVIQSGRRGTGYWAEAFAAPRGPVAVNRDPLYESHMMLRAMPRDAAGTPEELGVSCRICPREACPGRREPSILAGTA